MTQIIQPFHLISTSKDILPLLLYPTGFQRYPTIWNDSNPYPTIAGLSNHFSKLSNRLDRIKTISNHFRFIQPLSNCLDRFKPISNRFRFIQPFLQISNHFWIYPTISCNPIHSQFIQPFFRRYPTIWIKSNPNPTVFKFIQPFCRYPTVSGFIQPFPSIRFIPDLSNHGWISQKWLDMNISETVARRAKRPKKKPPAVPLWDTARVAYRFGSSSIQWYKNWKFQKFYPTIFGFIQPFPVIRFIPNLSNRFSGDIQPFGSNQIQIPLFLTVVG